MKEARPNAARDSQDAGPHLPQDALPLSCDVRNRHEITTLSAHLDLTQLGTVGSASDLRAGFPLVILRHHSLPSWLSSFVSANGVKTGSKPFVVGLEIRPGDPSWW